MKEVFKPIAGYEKSYQVSNLGNVKSLDRHDKRGVFLKGQFMKIQYDYSGGAYITLSDGIPKRFMIGRLVLTSFGNLPKENEVVSYKNGNKKDNSLKNIFWIHKRDIKIKKRSKSLTLQQIKKVKSYINMNKTNIEISKEFKVSDKMISRIRVRHNAKYKKRKIYDYETMDS